MSLIITSSQDPSNLPQLSISAPYQYRNDFKSGVKIPANSEIAVESVKINRNPALDYEQGQVTLFWFGERLATNASLDESMSWIIPSINRIDKNLSPTDFAEAYLPMMKMAYSLHPEIDSNNITMTPVTSSSNPFQGFRYIIPQIGASATSAVPPSGTEFLIYGDVAYDGTTITADADDTFVQLQPTGSVGGPISLFDGEVKFQNFTGTNWTVGISRPIYNKGLSYVADNPTFSHFSEYNDGLGFDGDQFYDYAVQAGVDGKVRLYHLTPDNQGGEGLVMKEITYYINSDSATTADNAPNSSFAGGSPIDATDITDITFKVQNEKVIISASGNVLVAPNTVTSASFKDQVPKPVNQNCWKMYPTVGLWEDTDDVDIATYRCRTNTTMFNNTLPNNWTFKSIIHADMDTVFLDAVDGAGDYVVNTPWDGAKNWARGLDNRDIMKRFLTAGVIIDDDDTSPFIRPYHGLQTKRLASYEPLLITGKSERYTENLVQRWTPNSMNVLGFTPYAVAPLEDSVAHNTGQASFTSSTRPSMTSENSTFIRVPTLNHKTFNFGTGNPSKILFQVPRFDNSGGETGALFFQNQDKTFIDLNNISDFTITDLDVHFVRKDEKFAKDLTGSSEVVFVIRQKSKL